MGITPQEIAALLNDNRGAEVIDVPGMGMRSRDDLLGFLTKGYGNLSDLGLPEQVHAQYNLADVYRAQLTQGEDGKLHGDLTAVDAGNGSFSYELIEGDDGKLQVGGLVRESRREPANLKTSHKSTRIRE